MAWTRWSAWRGIVVALLAGGAGLASVMRTAAAQGPAAQSGFLAGVVRDAAGNEIAGAEVVVMGTALRTRTDLHGAFQLRGAALGEAAVQVRRLGFKPAEVRARVTGEMPELLDVVLEQASQRLSPVVVRANRREYVGRLADFHRRRDAAAGGYFLTRAQIDSQRPYRTTDLLRRMPGVNIAAGSFAGNTVRMRGARCPPLVWIDGQPLAGGYFDPDNLDPRFIEAMEVYNGLASVPPALMGPRSLGACGVIAIWSRTSPMRQLSRERASAAELAALVDSLQVYTADQVDVPVTPDDGQPFIPPYPDQLRRSGTSGSVIVEFVVDTVGRVEHNTVGIVSSSHLPFAKAVESALPSASFTPALLGGRRVRQMVQMPVRFLGERAAAEPAPADPPAPPPRW